MAKTGYVYILSSRSRRLYIGVTSDLEGRVWDHKQGVIEGFTKDYKINLLVYYEEDRAHSGKKSRMGGPAASLKGGIGPSTAARVGSVVKTHA